MRITVEIDDEVVARVHRSAEALGTSVEELVRGFLVRFADASADADEFERPRGWLRRLPGWKFNREEIHARS